MLKGKRKGTSLLLINIIAGKERQGDLYMRYYSDVTKKFYDTAKECTKAEEEVIMMQAKEKEEKEKLAAERKNRAAEVEEARKKMVAAQNEYKEKLEAFIRDYKSYHYSSTNANEIPTLFNFFNWLN